MTQNRIRYAILDYIDSMDEDDWTGESLDSAKKTESLPQEPPQPDVQEDNDSTDSKIYFSYAWGDDKEKGASREDIVNQLYDSLMNSQYNVIRDKMDLGFGGLISKFMADIGAGDLIVVFLSDKYARSPYCMFELLEIARNNKWDKNAFTHRILPIRVEYIKWSDPIILDEYFQYWEDEENKWAKFIQKRIGQVSSEQTNQHQTHQKDSSEFWATIRMVIGYQF